MLNDIERLYLAGGLIAIQGIYLLTNNIAPIEITFSLVALITGLITPTGKLIDVVRGNNE